MSAHDTTRKDHGSDLGEDAALLLRSWGHEVAQLPDLIGCAEKTAAVRGLVRWYNMVAECDSCSVGPPIEGLDALVDELVHVCVPPDEHAQIAKARSAIRVAEELVQWRHAPMRERGGLTDPATARLELAVRQAISHFGDQRAPASSWTS